MHNNNIISCVCALLFSVSRIRCRFLLLLLFFRLFCLVAILLRLSLCTLCAVAVLCCVLFAKPLPLNSIFYCWAGKAGAWKAALNYFLLSIVCYVHISTMAFSMDFWKSAPYTSFFFSSSFYSVFVYFLFHLLYFHSYIVHAVRWHSFLFVSSTLLSI